MSYLLFYFPKIIIIVARDLVFFPVWWYTLGAWDFIGGIKSFLIGQEQMLGVTIWIKNIFRPMYAQTDWQGRLISFFMRVAQIILRSIYFLVLIIFCIFIFLGWLLLPPFIIYELVLQFIP